MIELKPSAITDSFLNTDSQMPLIICYDSSRLYRKLADAGYQELKLNSVLAKALLVYAPQDRPNQVENELKKILAYNVPVLITDFEMLFDPRYEIDVVKLFCEKARVINVAVKWPGKYSDGKLIYAEPECKDYHEYICSAYQIRIVQ